MLYYNTAPMRSVLIVLVKVAQSVSWVATTTFKTCWQNSAHRRSFWLLADFYTQSWSYLMNLLQLQVLNLFYSLNIHLSTQQWSSRISEMSIPQHWILIIIHARLYLNNQSSCYSFFKNIIWIIRIQSNTNFVFLY